MYFATHKTCNLSCKYCYVPSYNRDENKVKDSEILNSLIQFIQKAEDENYAIGSFCFHGSEPSLMSATTLAQAVILVNDHWSRTGIKDQIVAIQSNGKRFTEDYLVDLVKVLGTSKLLKLGFSIDPPEEVHNYIRDNTFSTVINNYNKAQEMGFRTSVLSVISKMTMQYLDGFGIWMKKELIKSHNTKNPYRIKIKFATGEMALTEDEILKFTDYLINEELLNLPQMLTPGYCIQNGNECMWFEFDIFGNCYSCNKSYNDEGNFANWKNDSFKKIFEKRRNLYNLEFTNSECSECEFEFLCNSGCPLDRNKDGTMIGKAHECTMIKKVYGHIMNHTDKHLIEFYNSNI